MNQYMSYNLSFKNIENFSLLKGKKNRIFAIYKTLKCKYANQNYKSGCLNISICRKNLIITKTITLNYIKAAHMNKNSDRIKNSLVEKHNSGVKKIKNKINPNKYCKNLINKFMKNSNALIKPIMYEDTLYKKQKTINKVEKSSNQINICKKNDFVNQRFYFNNIYNNFNNSFKINNYFKKENYFTNKNINFNNSFEKKLSPPTGKKENLSFDLSNDKIKELNNISLNFDFLKDNKIIDPNNIFKLSKNPSKGFEKSSPNQKITKNKQILKTIYKNKGRKTKNSKYLINDSKHTKYSSDNMMRKIKNKVIESSRLLANRIIKEETKNSCNLNFNLFNKEFRKIQGSFSQELNIKYNCWFYQIKIKDIFSMELSNKYTTIEKTSNVQLINFIFSPINEKFFLKTKVLLNTPFHQYYHDIFLNENKNWKIYYGIHENDQKYQIENMIKNIQEEEKELSNDLLKYINDIDYLAHHYEEYFLQKKPRNVDYNNKKNKFIKDFMNNLVNNEYLKLCEELKQLKIFYENRKLLNNKFESNSLIVQKNQKSDDTLDNSLLIKNNNFFTSNSNNEIKNIIEYKDNQLKIIDDIIINSTIQKTKNENLGKNNISLEEKINEFCHDKNCNDIKEKTSKKSLGDELEKNSYKENNFCNRKRKIRFFIRCKNYKKDKISNNLK
jgi:hypothetical protein